MAACATISSRSRRTVGSPPDRCSWRTPRSAACVNTSSQTLGRQLIAGALERQRVGAIGALQRAAVGQLRQQPDRARRRAWGQSGGIAPPHSYRHHALVGEVLQHGSDIAQDRFAWRVVGLRQLACYVVDLRVPSHSLRTATRHRIGREYALGRQDRLAVTRRVVAHLDMARQFGLSKR